MSQLVMHQPRVAWEGARAVVAAAGRADDRLFTWFAGRLVELLGPGSRDELIDTRAVLVTAVDERAALTEAGMWRVRLDDALRTRPELVTALHELTEDITDRLGAPSAA